MIRLFIAYIGLQSYTTSWSHICKAFIEDFLIPHDAWEAVKNVENLKPYSHISNTDKRAIAASAKG